MPVVPEEARRIRIVLARIPPRLNGLAETYYESANRVQEANRERDFIQQRYPEIGTRHVRAAITDWLWLAGFAVILVIDFILIWQAFDFITESLLAGAPQVARQILRVALSCAIAIGEILVAYARTEGEEQAAEGMIERPPVIWMLLSVALNIAVPAIVVATAAASGFYGQDPITAAFLVLFLTALALVSHGLAVWGGQHMVDALTRRWAAWSHRGIEDRAHTAEREAQDAGRQFDADLGQWERHGTRLDALGVPRPQLSLGPRALQLLRDRQGQANPGDDPQGGDQPGPPPPPPGHDNRRNGHDPGGDPFEAERVMRDLDGEVTV